MLPVRMMTQRPDRIIILMDEETDIAYSEAMATAAVQAAKDRMPKITGNLARTLTPVFGRNFWGIYFPDKRAWFLEQGTRPFTMNSLAGKTIPMWVDDPDGSVAKQAGKKAETRVTEDGRHQTLIFRKASRKGARRTVLRRGLRVSVPASYPGAPGRIGTRDNSGRIASGNVGVRWRHPGIEARRYLIEAIEDTAEVYGIDAGVAYLIDAATYPTATKA